MIRPNHYPYLYARRILLDSERVSSQFTIQKYSEFWLKYIYVKWPVNKTLTTTLTPPISLELIDPVRNITFSNVPLNLPQWSTPSDQIDFNGNGGIDWHLMKDQPLRVIVTGQTGTLPPYIDLLLHGLNRLGRY